MREHNAFDYRGEIEKIPGDTPKEKLPALLEDILRKLVNETEIVSSSILMHVIKRRFSLTIRDIVAYEKTLKEYRKEHAIQAQALREKADEKKEEPVADEARREAEKILSSSTLLYDALCMVRKFGVVGEERTALIHYLALTSRLLRKPISITVKGDSSAGKSFTLGNVMKLFPKSEFIDLTDATAQSFFYMKADRFKHKMIILFEKHGSQKADYSIRSLQSEGVLKISVTMKNRTTGEFETKEIEKEGPTGFITTTTDSRIHAENETRNISVFPDQSEYQTSLVYEANERRYLGIEGPPEEEIKSWQNAQRLIEKMPVLIPFAPKIRPFFPKTILRTRRDHAHFLALVEVSALLHQKQRKIVGKNGKNYVEATVADYEIARIIAEEFLSKSIYELPPKTIEAIEAAREFIGSDEFTVTELSKKIGWDRDTVDKWMQPGTDKGYFTLTQDNRGSIGAKYKVEEKDLPGASFLPSYFEIAESDLDLSHCYHPLTGVRIVEKSINNVTQPLKQINAYLETQL